VTRIALDDLSILRPIFVLKLKFAPEGYARRLVAELWLSPDNSMILELSTTCAPSEAFQVAAETKGVDGLALTGFHATWVMFDLAGPVRMGGVPRSAVREREKVAWQRMSETQSTYKHRSSAAVGWTTFAAIMLIMIGAFHAIAGLAGIIENEFYRIVPAAGTEASGDVYFLQFDVTTWGWIHLIGGFIALFAGFALFGGAVWARTVGVIVAVISAIANFAFLPYYPVWSIAIIAIDITVIWALTAHGRDIVQ